LRKPPQFQVAVGHRKKRVHLVQQLRRTAGEALGKLPLPLGIGRSGFPFNVSGHGYSCP
jgi:hypothetical protein